MTKNIIKEYTENKIFYRNLFYLTIPIVLQSLVTSSLNMLDTMMIGRIGETELASVGIANQYYFLFTLFVLGIAGGCGVLIAQLWGKKDTNSIRVVLAKSLAWGLFVSLAFSIIGLIIPGKIIALFSKDILVQNLGSEYLRIVAFSYIFTAISFIFSSSLRSIGNTKLPMYASILGLLINGALNYVLIFGHFGFPQLATKGAAIATLIARIIECSIILYAVTFKRKTLKLEKKDFKGLSNNMLKTLTKVTLPIVINETSWGLGNVTYIAIYARIGTKAAAAIQICSTILNLFMIFAFGLAYAAVVIIGNEVGAGNEEKAIDASKKISILSVIMSILMGIMLFSSTKTIVSFFNISSEVKQYSTYILYIYSLIMTVKVFNLVMIVGILRGGGDATYGSILQTSTLWLIGIPLAYISAFLLNLPVYMVVTFTAVEELIKVILLLRRFKSYRWIKNVIDPGNMQEVTAS
ncbi:MAG: MATE family efflux transporter [Firmicutes bacterium]|jgi:putative MATE family efflux protein|nr:MATE family efflux transporter [Bacillota bacterium]